LNAELVIHSSAKGVEIALLHDKILVELHREESNTQFAVGDIYLGRIRKMVPHLNATFIDVGYEKDAFLHFLDLGPHFPTVNKFVRRVLGGEKVNADLSGISKEPELKKDGVIKDAIGQGNAILVQIAKEPISAKGPRLTAEITLAGRYLVLVPFSNKVSLSSRITNEEERDRLKKLMQKIRPQNMGVIVRTQAVDTSVAELDQDLTDLLHRWEEMVKNLKNQQPPKRILSEIKKTSSVLRDLLSDQFTAIHVNDEKMYHEIRNYLKSIAPEQEGIVKLHKMNDLFDAFNIYRQLKSGFAKQVNLKSGAYLIVEHTEAMHVIDVNSGNRKSASAKDQEENALQTNMECAKEIARLLRLRDMGGIICVDFIDMQQKENQKKLHDALKEFMKGDKAKHNVLAPSRFGVVEITRERVKPVTEVETTESCPSCNGTGKVESALLFEDEIENNIRLIVQNSGLKHIQVAVHPILAAYLTKGWWFNTILAKWKKRFAIKIDLISSSNNALLEVQYFDSNGEAIK
jgi:ribonuclease G